MRFGRSAVVEDANLTVAISTLRKACEVRRAQLKLHRNEFHELVIDL